MTVAPRHEDEAGSWEFMNAANENPKPGGQSTFCFPMKNVLKILSSAPVCSFQGSESTSLLDVGDGGDLVMMAAFQNVALRLFRLTG